MEFRHLQAFAIAAERESFTRAAEELDVTQAAVSQQIAALEKQLGRELFERGGRGVQLTARGRRLYGFARQILDLIDEATRQVCHSDQEMVGELRIATSTVPAEWLLPDLLREFRSRWPQVRESLIVSDSQHAATAVENGEAEVGFVGELPHSPQIEARAVADDEMVLFASTDNPLAATGTTTLKRLRSESLIVRELGSASRRCVERELDEHGIAPDEMNIAMEVNSNDAIRAAVQRGVGVAFLSHQANRHHTGLVAIKVRGLKARRRLYVIRSTKHPASALARLFLDFVDEWKSRNKSSD